MGGADGCLVLDWQAMSKKLRCYLGLHHYERRRTEEGEAYKECRDCQKLRDQTAFTVTVSQKRS